MLKILCLKSTSKVAIRLGLEASRFGEVSEGCCVKKSSFWLNILRFFCEGVGLECLALDPLLVFEIFLE